MAVLAARETPEVLEATLAATLSAVIKPATIDVLVNGNQALAGNSKKIIAALSHANKVANFRLWFISLGDKAYTWNLYLHTLWPGDGLTFFVDGYSRPFPDAFMLLEQGLDRHPVALGASGVPTVGRTSGQLRAAQIHNSGIHGNLFCLRTETMRSFQASGFRLPLGIYRTDPTIGAVLKFGHNPKVNTWEANRIHVESEASWVTDEKQWWSYSQLKGQFKRLIRQAQGDLENRAIRHHFAVCKRLPGELPSTVADLVATWIREDSAEAAIFLKNPLRRLALNQLRKPRNWSLAVAPPELIEFTTIS